MDELSPAIVRLLSCPGCQGSLELKDEGARCAECGTRYPRTDRRQFDLRLQQPRSYPIEFEIGTPPREPDVGAIPVNPSPTIDYRSIEIPPILYSGNRLTRELLSWFPRSERGGTMLDVGCGGDPFKEVCRHTNLEYIGVDYEGDTPVLADAHALPFKDDSFDFVTSFAVFEHIRYPFVAMREICRVLKPGARFIGTVAFLEPFHLHSYFHPSSLGTDCLLRTAGLEIEQLEPNVKWMGLNAQAKMSLFPHAPKVVSDLIVLPVNILHRLWWKLGNLAQNRPATSEHARRVTNTAGFRFVCTKPAEGSSARQASSQEQVVAGVDAR